MVKFNIFFTYLATFESFLRATQQQLMAPPVHCMLHSDIFNDENTEEQEYIATLMMTNLDKKKALETQI